MTTPVCTIDATGCHRPDFSTVLSYIQSQYQAIYGADIYIDQTTPDGQFLALIANAIHDCNAQTVATYNSFSPTNAVGSGLSSLVKINGITRAVPTYSTATLVITGVYGTIINGGVAGDANGYQWALPSTVTIPLSGTVSVIATCTTVGAIMAAANTILSIQTPVVGWQTVNNPSAASIGAPLETDAALRTRQSISASLPAISPFVGLQAAIAAIPSVGRYAVYENADGATNTLGIPGHSVAVVVDGGSPLVIANTIALKKGIGVSTFGTTSAMTTPDSSGISRTINYSVTSEVPVTFSMQVKPRAGFTTQVQSEIASSLSAWVNGLGIGNSVYLADANIPARLYGTSDSSTFSIVPDSLAVARSGASPSANDVSIAYNEAPFSDPSYVLIKLVT